MPSSSGRKAGRLASRLARAACLAALLLLASAGQGTAQEANASGTLTLNGVTTVLRHAYADAGPGAFDKTKEDIRILLSDVPLTEADRRNAFGLIRLGRETGAAIVEVLLDADADPISGAIYARAFNGMVSLSGMHVFEKQRFEHRLVEGRLHTRQPGDFMNVSYAYDASFAAAIPRPPTPEEVAAALASPAARAATAYITRIPDAPKDTVVTGVTHQSATSATATLQGHENGIIIEYVLTVRLDNGAWRVVE